MSIVRSDDDDEEFCLSWVSMTRAEAIATFFEQDIRRKIESLVTAFVSVGPTSVSLNFNVPLLNTYAGSELDAWTL